MRYQTREPELTFMEKALAILIGLLIGAAFVAAYTALICLAWNYAVVALFRLPAVHFWQVLAVMFLLGVVKRMLSGKPNTSKS